MVEIDFNGTQSRYLEPYNTETATQSYALINIAAGTSIQINKQQPINIHPAVNNLFNSAYQSNLNRLKHFE